MAKLWHSLSAVALAVLIAGVGAAAKPVTITYWHGWTGEWEAEINKIVKQFNDTHPGIVVKPIIVGDTTTKLVTSMAAGIVPDVVTIWDPVIAAMADRNILTPLDSLIKGERKGLTSWFYPYALELGQYGGKIWALPSSLNAYSLLYNKRIFREAGLDPEHPPTTIDELDLYANKMAQKGANGAYTRMGFWPSGFDQWAHQFGGNFWNAATNKVTFTDPKVVKALEWMTGYGTKYDLKLVSKFTSTLGGDRAGAKDAFLAGKYGMVLHGQWKVGDIKKFAKSDFDYGSAFLPSVPGGPYGSCVINGNMQVIPRGSKHLKEAWEFVKFWSGFENEDYAAKMMNIGERPVWVPVSQSIYKHPTYQKYLREYPAMSVFVESASNRNTQPVTIMPGQQAFNTERGNAEYQATQGLKSAQVALATAQAQVQKEVDRQLSKRKAK